MAQIISDVSIAARELNRGGVVAMPTETVYGLAGNALDENAVLKIFDIKKRPSFDPLIIHIPSIEHIDRYVNEVPPILKDIIPQFSPGAISYLLPKKDIISDIVTSGLDRVAVRIPSHPLTRELLEAVDFPLAAPSANPFGYISPTTAQHVVDQLGDQLNYVLDGGPCPVGIESTIIGIEDDRLVIYRKGGMSVDAFRPFDKDLIIKAHSESNPNAPGMLKSHYAPNCPFKIVHGDNPEAWNIKTDRVGVIIFGDGIECPAHWKVYNLSQAGDLQEAARNLFAYMRELDQQNLDVILARPVPDVGLGMAINDRLKRASV